jgi:ribosome maturation factor RimP
MKATTNLRAIEELLRPLIEDMGFELVDLRLLSGAGRLTLQLLVDREGGITLDECAKVSREVAPHLEVADLVRSSYVLEVSSPGIRRPLTRIADFDRFRDQVVALKTGRALDGRKRFRGVNLGLDEEGRIVLDAEDGVGRIAIAWDDVEEARLDPEIRFK